MVAVTPKFGAASSAIGYLYQCRYALFLALKIADENPNASISMERFDDISVDDDGNPLVNIQTKVHTKTEGDLTDSSPDLWKTIRVWSTYMKDHPEANSQIRFVLMTTGIAPANSISSMLRPEGRDEATALSKMLKVCSVSKNVANQPAYAEFKSLGDDGQQSLLSLITILDSSPDILNVLDMICARLRYVAPKDKLEHFVDRLEGWWSRRLIYAMMTGDTSIPISDLELYIDDLREAFKRGNLPLDYDNYSPPDAITKAYASMSFVRQLRIIGIKEGRIGYAIRDFIRAFGQRSLWVNQSFVYDTEIAKYESRLLEHWQPRYAEMCDELGDSSDSSADEKQGRAIYKWIEQDANIPFRTETSRYVCVGSFHMLSDKLRVGWHPKYKSLLQSVASGEE